MRAAAWTSRMSSTAAGLPTFAKIANRPSLGRSSRKSSSLGSRPLILQHAHASQLEAVLRFPRWQYRSLAWRAGQDTRALPQPHKEEP